MTSDFESHFPGTFGPHEVRSLREVHERLLSQSGQMSKDAEPNQVARLVISAYSEMPGDIEVVLENCIAKLATIQGFSVSKAHHGTKEKAGQDDEPSVRASSECPFTGGKVVPIQDKPFPPHVERRTGDLTALSQDPSNAPRLNAHRTTADIPFSNHR